MKADLNLQGGVSCPPTVSQSFHLGLAQWTLVAGESLQANVHEVWPLSCAGQTSAHLSQAQGYAWPVTHSLKTPGHVFLEECKQGKELYKNTLENLDHH